MEGISNSKERKIRDKAQSKFMHVIYFKNGKSFPGYSKQLGWAERRVPEANLINFILRICVDNEYLIPGSTRVTPVDRIEYFTNKSEVPGRADWRHFLTLDYYNPEWINIKYQTPRLRHFFDQLYDKLRRQLPKEAILQDLLIVTREPKTDPLCLEKPRFGRLLDLEQHCFKLRHQGVYDDEVIQNFFAKYKEKYFAK